MAARFRRQRIRRAQPKQARRLPLYRCQPTAAAQAPVVEGNNIPDILHSDVIDPVSTIINTLDPVSFLILAMTSKEMRQHCINNRTKIVELAKERMTVSYDERGYEAQLKIYTELSSGGRLRKVNDVASHVTMVQRMQETLPVTMKMECVRFSETQIYGFVDFTLIDHASVNLREMGVSQVGRVEIEAWLYMWRETVRFINEFQVKTVSVVETQWHDRGLQHIYQCDLNELICNPVHPGNDWILASTIPRIVGAPVGRRALKPIFDMWMTTVALDKWSIRVEDLDEEDLFDCVTDFNFLDFNATAPLPAQRPLVFSHQDDETEVFSFFILRGDDKVIRMAVEDPFVTLDFPPLADGPVALRP